MTFKPNHSQQWPGHHRWESRQPLGKELYPGTDLLQNRGQHVPVPPAQSNLPLSSNMKTKVLDCVNWHRCHQMLQGIYKWPSVSSRVCTLAFQEMIKDNTWLLCFLLPVHSNVMQSFLLKHEAPRSLLLKSCLREVNIGANTTYERKTSSMYFVLNHQ